jgi:MSHA pilin protein MshD
MNTGQMMLTLGALMLLSFLALRMNTNLLSTEELMQNSKYGVLGISLATSLIEEANLKAFDKNSVDSSLTNVNELTAVGSLGKESGETYPDFDDFDDFNNYTRIDSTMPSAVFDIACKVVYVSSTNPDVTSSSRTWNKKITVSVTSKNMTDTVRVSSVFSYWFYR